jgi:hypothetical protein
MHNENSIKLANNLVYHLRTKHVDTQFHFVPEKMRSNDISLMYCNTSENVVFSLSLLEGSNLNYLGAC